MEESQNEILQLLRENQQPALAQQEEVFLPQNPPRVEDVQFGHLQAEVHLPPRRRFPQSRQDSEIVDTASSTHPPPSIRQPRILPDLPEDSAQPHGAELPHDALRHELRKLLREEFPQGDARQTLRQRDFQESSPLTEAILQHPIPARFKLPSIESYDETSDSYEHIDHYRTIMHIQRAPNALLCQVFPATLKGQARTWFYCLCPGPFYSALMRDTVPSYANLIHRIEAQISANEAINAHRKQFEYRGHSTEACRQLKEEIVRLIRQGYLRQFIQNPPPREETRPAGGQERQHRPPVNNRIAIGEIETIVGGPLLSDKVFLAVDKTPTPKKARVDHSITFDDSDLEGVKTPHQDPLVINAGIGDPCYNVKRILVDNGSSVDVLFYSTFLNMGLTREMLQPAAGPLYGFDNRTFIVVKSESAYNAIFGRPLQLIFWIVTSIPHLKLKFHTPTGVSVVCGDQQTAQTCYLRQVKTHPADTLNIEYFDLWSEDIPQRASPVEELTTDIFAWSPADIPGIDPEVIVHSLKVNPANKPVIQKKRNFTPDRQQAIEQEVDKLLKAGFIQEVHHPNWLANIVLVRKGSGAWRMCIDYTDLNKACPKDSFPLPCIDQLVDTTSGHQMLSFMDAYSSYNQIKMNPTDEEAPAFQTDRGLYCYRVMPFRLKNAGATYHRLMNKVFKTLIGRNMEVYVDDMLVKSLEKSQYISDLEQCFRLLRRYNMRLIPTKCAFRVASGKFMGFMVTHRGIEANPEKIKALRDMVPPKNIKEVQRLNGRIAALSRFLARSGDKYLPFFKILRGARNSGFKWTDECQEAFEQLRKYLASPPLLSKPTSREKLYLYITVSTQAISSVLVREENATQRPVYYVSKILSETEGRYSLADKTTLALVYSIRKLRPYFQTHSIGVYTNLPLKSILQKPEASGRLVKWSVELGEFDIHYLPIKSQALADFVVECTVPASDVQTGTLPSPPRWTLYVNGSSGGSGVRAGILLISPQEVTLEYGLRLKFPATNNMAEYEALITWLKLAIDCEVQNLVVHTDSQLVAFQVEGEFEIHNPQQAQYCKIAKLLLTRIGEYQIIHILREKNARADALSKLATSTT
ncbi:uncharacterized protein LOC110115884 [Dendrobium catenatum]|uniref:uncharacterized protein LOC110115884 n=1 Tax=Dendrobium catenatum TaxID=906689 RepID=UPI0010A02406|nr:uncharacterized protein LOC110115884 [Dendrobium catenatum]